MGLIFWWLLLVWIIVLAGYYFIQYLRRTRRKIRVETAIAVAHSYRLTKLPAYVRALARYELLVRIATGSLSLALILAMLVSARPATVVQVVNTENNRDIMLCLDVSGSMLQVDATFVHRFQSIVNQFSSQRFGLTVFNSSSFSVIPLTNDYNYVSAQLQQVTTSLTVQKGQAFTNLTSGTLANFSQGTSLVGDGLEACMQNFGPNPQLRPQSVVLATDNKAQGTAIVSVVQDSQLAIRRGIRIYVIDPNGTSNAAAELRTISQQTGGAYYALSDHQTVNSIVTAIATQEAAYSQAPPTAAKTDNPRPLLYSLLLMVGVSMTLLWRLRL